MSVHLDPEVFKFFFIIQNCGSVCEACENDAAHIESVTSESIDKTKHVHVVCDSEIAADLVLLDVRSVYGDNDLCLILELCEHVDLGVGLKTRENTRRMEVVEKLPSELQIELSSEACDPLPDLLGLHFDVLFVIEACTFFHDDISPVPGRIPGL